MNLSYKRFKFNKKKDKLTTNIKTNALHIEKYVMITTCVIFLTLLVGLIPYYIYQEVEVAETTGFHRWMFFVIIGISTIISAITGGTKLDDNEIRKGYYSYFSFISYRTLVTITILYSFCFITYYFGYITTLIF